MSDMEEVKRLIEDQGRAWEEFKKANDEAIKAKADGKSVADLEVKLAKANEALNAIDEIKARLDEAEKRANRPRGGGEHGDAEQEVKSFNAAPFRRRDVNVDAPGLADYKAAARSFLRANGNLELLSDAERKTLQAGVLTDGGYLVTPPVMASVVTKMRELSTLRGIVGQISISTNRIEGLVDRDDVDSGWVGEIGSRTATGTPETGKDAIDVHEMYAYPELSQQIIEDAAIDVEAWVSGKVAQSFADLENAAYFSGNGVAKPRGLFSYTTAETADASRTWGQFEHIKSGASGAFAASNPSNYLFDVMAALKTPYHSNARWLTRRSVLNKIRQFKDTATGNYLWQPGLTAGAPSQLLAHPVVLDENVPALGAASLSLAFGDFQRGYLIVDRLGMTMLRDPYTSKPKVGLYFRRRTGGAARDFDAVKFMSFQA